MLSHLSSKKISVCLLSVSSFFCAMHTAQAVSVGDVFTEDLTRHAGGKLAAADFLGKVTIINFWATWCAACKVELVEMQTEFASLRQQPAVQFAFVSLDKDPEQAKAWFQQHLKQNDAMLKDLFIDSQFTVADRLGVDAFPMTLIIGQDGKVVHVQRGFKEGDGATKELVRLVEKQLYLSSKDNNSNQAN